MRYLAKANKFLNKNLLQYRASNEKDILVFVQNILVAINSSDQLKLAFSSPFLTKEQKFELLKSVITNENVIAINFFEEIINKNQYFLINDLITAIEKKLFELKNEVSATVILPKEKKDISTIIKFIESQFQKKVSYNVEIEKNLIGGFKVVVEDKIYDASIKNVLSKINSNLN